MSSAADASTCAGSKPDVSIAASQVRPRSGDDVGAVAAHVLDAVRDAAVQARGCRS